MGMYGYLFPFPTKGDLVGRVTSPWPRVNSTDRTNANLSIITRFPKTSLASTGASYIWNFRYRTAQNQRGRA